MDERPRPLPFERSRFLGSIAVLVGTLTASAVALSRGETEILAPLVLVAAGAAFLLLSGKMRSHKIAITEVARQRETLRVTLASIGDGIVTTDVAGRVQYLNAEAERLTGWKSSEASGLPLEEIFPIVHEETRQPVENPAIRALKEGIVVALAQPTVLLGRDGVERPIGDLAAPIRDARGGVCGVVLVFRDVAKEREATNQLRRLAIELAEADGRKNEFLALLAHEIRNPLAAIRNSVAVLRYAGGDPEAAAAAQGAIHRQMAHMTRLVDDLLDVSSISHGKLAHRPASMDLVAALEQAIEAIRPDIDRKGQTLTVARPELPCHIHGDATRMTQAIGNLLSNASKFTQRGGTIAVSVSVENGQAVVRVRDDGIGIAAENLPQIFEMFSQVDTSLERTQQGLGLGLHLVKQLAEMHGGRVEARSEGAGRGSEFLLSLPAITPPAESEPVLDSGPLPAATDERSDPTPKALTPASRLRILVVDDNVDSAESLGTLLRLQGHQAQVVHDGLEGVAEALRTRPDVVLLDIGLPGINGYEVARRIRSSPRGTEMRLIALTGLGRPEDRELTTRAGFDEHFVKPVDHQRLMALLATTPALVP